MNARKLTKRIECLFAFFALALNFIFVSPSVAREDAMAIQPTLSEEFFDSINPETILSSLAAPQELNNDYIRIHFKNKCYKDIQVAIRFKDMDGIWQTKGWWIIKSYGEVYAENTRNGIYYYTGLSTDGQLQWTGSDGYWSVRGSRNSFGFKQHQVRSFGDHYLHFTCN